MATPMTIVLQIDGFCNCEGCIQKVRKALRELGGVKLLAMNPEIGEFTIFTTKHAEVVKFALKQTFPKKNIILIKSNHPNELPAYKDLNNLITRQNPFSLVTTQGATDVHEMAKALVTLSHAKGLESVEITQSNTLKMNYTNRDQNQPSTSRSSSTLHNDRGFGGHVKDDGFGDVHGLPPNATKPSAPLIPLTEDPVYGYPVELYGAQRSSKYENKRDPHGCCTIL